MVELKPQLACDARCVLCPDGLIEMEREEGEMD